MKKRRLSEVVAGLALVILITADCCCGEKMRIQDLQAITAEKGKYVVSRRYKERIPQLVCTGGSAGCRAFAPKTVRCVNEGWDGLSTQWECKADMSNIYKFGSISVECEGYDYPDDEYILKGSCSVQFSLELADSRDRRIGRDDYDSDDRRTYVILFVLFLLLLAYFIYSRLFSGDTESSEFERPSGPDIGWNIPHAKYKEKSPYEGFHPPPSYSGSESTFNQYSGRRFQTNQAGGFWTGLGAGGLLGYLYGSQRNPAPSSRTSSYSRDRYYGGNDSNSDDRTSTSSGNIRTATAYCGTKRR